MESNIIFSKMQLKDLDQVAEIEKRIFSTPWTKEGFAEALEKPYCCFITAKEKNGKIAGYCGMYKSCSEADITNVAIDEKFRQRGIASAMLKELMNLGYADGIKDFTLEVRAENTPAINLYQSLGFECVGTRKNFYRNPIEDAKIMWLYDYECETDPVVH